MQTSRNGILFIAGREGLVLTSYFDGGNYSIGFGTNSPTIKAGDTITVKQAFNLLKQGLGHRDAELSKALTVPVLQNEFDALSSLIWNTGHRYAPRLIAAINSHKASDAAKMFPDCDKNKAGQQMDGLHRRRLAEQAIFMRGDYGPLDSVPFWPGDPHKTHRQEYVVKPGDL